MKKVFLNTTVASLISAVAVELTGLVINLISYKATGDLLLGKELYGGEWDGKQGFGLLLNRVYPFITSSQQEMKVHKWLEFDSKSLIRTLFTSFLFAFVVFFTVYKFISNKANRKTDS